MLIGSLWLQQTWPQVLSHLPVQRMPERRERNTEQESFTSPSQGDRRSCNPR